MTKNVGCIDRAAHIVAGVVLLSMPMFVTSNWQWLGLAGLVFIIAALLRWCPAYGVLGVKTCPTENR
jgi:hypothetical protein